MLLLLSPHPCSVPILLSPQSCSVPILLSPHLCSVLILLSPHLCSVLPALSLSLLSQPLYALHTPGDCLCYHTPKHVTSIPWLPMLSSQMGKHQQAALHTASVKCDMYGAICRGLQTSSKQPGRHCSSCCTAHQPCTCPPQQIHDSISTRRRSRCLSRGAITKLGRSSHDASCCW